MTIIQNIIKLFVENRVMHIKELADKYPEEKPYTTIRARVYENKHLFDKVAPGVYTLKEEVYNQEVQLALIEGNGRDLSLIPDKSIDAIITDHPWSDDKSNKGGDRNFDNQYDTFRYTLEDMKEQARVLKDGGFMVQILPAENENNWEYLYQIKQMLKSVGVKYYSKVPWKKGNFVSNTGRKSKNTEDVMIFTKGKARSLRLDKKKIKATGVEHFMSGTSSMLPTEFNVQPTHIKKRIHQAEKPVELYQQIIRQVTQEGETVLDMFAGSGNLGVAALKEKRNAVLIEILKDNIQKIKENISNAMEEMGDAAVKMVHELPKSIQKQNIQLKTKKEHFEQISLF